MAQTQFFMRPGHVSGFGADAVDIAEEFRALAGKYTGAMELPAPVSTLLADLVVPLREFQDNAANSHRRDAVTLAGLAEHSVVTARAFYETDGGTDPLTAVRAADSATFPGEPNIAPADLSARRVVDWAIDMLSPYEPKLRESGFEPIANYLAPIACDWGELQPLATMIAFLGSNDRALARNVETGCQRLEPHWVGHRATSFSDSVTRFVARPHSRAEHMQTVARTVQHGGHHIERLVIEQASTLVEDLMRPTDHLDFSLPLALYGTILSQPMPANMHASIVADLNSVTDAARARHDNIISTVRSVQSALTSTPGWESPHFTASVRTVSSRRGSNHYGFRNNREWQVGLETPSVS